MACPHCGADVAGYFDHCGRFFCVVCWTPTDKAEIEALQRQGDVEYTGQHTLD